MNGASHAMAGPLADGVSARSGLDLRTRELLAIALLAGQGADDADVSAHVQAALNAGAEAGEIIEALRRCAGRWGVCVSCARRVVTD